MSTSRKNFPEITEPVLYKTAVGIQKRWDYNKVFSYKYLSILLIFYSITLLIQAHSFDNTQAAKTVSPSTKTIMITALEYPTMPNR